MSATDRAYDFAKERILDGRYDGGALISEGEVAEGVGLSRTPVREAFLRLESDGLLRLYPKRGALVVPVSVSEVESVMETRLLVERHALEKVVRRGVDLAEQLHAELDRQRRLADADRPRDFVEADREFHRLFVAGAGNPILLALHDSLRDRQSRMGLTALARDDRRTQQILAQHAELAAAVLAGDAPRAVTVIDRHLEDTRRLLLPHPPIPRSAPT